MNIIGDGFKPSLLHDDHGRNNYSLISIIDAIRLL